jgi:adenosine deaminase
MLALWYTALTQRRGLLLQDSSVEAELRKLRIPVEVCLTSNVKTGAVQSVADHHLRRLAASRHPLTLAVRGSVAWQ